MNLVQRVVGELNKYGIKINHGLITFDSELSVGQVIDNVKMLEYIGYINQGCELPEFNTNVKNQEEYYKDIKTALLYDIMIWFRYRINFCFIFLSEIQKGTCRIRLSSWKNFYERANSYI